MAAYCILTLFTSYSIALLLVAKPIDSKSIDHFSTSKILTQAVQEWVNFIE